MNLHQLISCVVLWVKLVHSLTDVTSKVFSDNVNGLIGAFGDFNADKLTDVFFITDEGSALEVYFAQLVEEPILSKSSVRCAFKDKVITSVVPADYDGDSRMDVLVTLQAKNQEAANYSTEFRILWGDLSSVGNCEGSTEDVVNRTLQGQPLVMDYNGDRIPDLYGETLDGKRQIVIMHGDKTFSALDVDVDDLALIRHPHSNSFVDLDNDMGADLLVTVENKAYEMWYNKNNTFLKPKVFPFNITGAAVIGQSIFLDIDLDGKLDHIVPVCGQPDCSINSSIYVLVENGLEHVWVLLKDDFRQNREIWNFVVDDGVSGSAINIRVGDYNLDGYPDLVVILTSTSGSSKGTRAFLLENTSCRGCRFHRRFVTLWDNPSLNSIPNVTQAAFYDIYEDGILDLLIVSRTPANKLKTYALLNTITADVCFIKIVVLSGICYNDCPHKHIPYGCNQPGPIISYKTTKPDGSPQVSRASQLYQSAHFSLQLPYTVFGLGQTPNFVEDLSIGIPFSSNEIYRTHSWTSLIPNSQMMVIPLRKEHTNMWLTKLFVTPSHQVILTLIALAGTCAFIIVIIAGLHWKERIADKKEKLQEAHRFHFDAM